ncbi:MAG TPA: hypothetical protein VD763_02440, partial [Candidatus Saccharimonadales bacterium]|nr:hypothetical protein [Candidatus Saccharimonadales bacterium]
LCGSCVHSRLVTTRRGSTFRLCALSVSDPRFPKYPALPVVSCLGYERDPAVVDDQRPTAIRADPDAP